ncbi:alpha/beta fold hydrolase [Coxiella endosymbiont of Ornithodoros maritimus]|uniref:alpha/beta fold hydrolase n=1 Tax=Coxiella endosymbiont of Ornithodoros maritimus TaxID=1656172 RepID=UPI00226493EB|nr:alpha/beta hydrolase [Coxiella endosymbiont of Ornithodoros maritimus]
MKLLFYEAYPVKLERRSYLLKFYRSYKERLERTTKIVFADATILENSLRISVPTLIIWGKQDHLLSVKSASAVRANIKGSRLVILGKSGHLLPLEKPTIAASIYLNFL